MKQTFVRRALCVVLSLFLAIYAEQTLIQPVSAVQIKVRPSVKKTDEREENADAKAEKNLSAAPQDKSADNSLGTGTKSASVSSDAGLQPSTEKSTQMSDKQETLSLSTSSTSEELKRPTPMTSEEKERRFSRDANATAATLEFLIPTKALHNVRVLKAFTRVSYADFTSKSSTRKQRVTTDASSLQRAALFNTAYPMEALEPQETDRVLVVESGNGFSAVVLSYLTSDVYAIGSDRSEVKRLADFAKKRGFSNLVCKQGNPNEGWSVAGPFDKIFVTRAIPELPEVLMEQLKEGGKMVAPIGGSFRQFFVLYEKKDGEITETKLLPTRVETMTASANDRVVGNPILTNGSFEELDPEPVPLGPTVAPVNLYMRRDTETNTASTQGGEANFGEIIDGFVVLPKRRPTPVGWYDAWNFEIISRGDVADGRNACLFSNDWIVVEHRKKDHNEERRRAATLPEERAPKTEAGEVMKARQRDSELRSQMRQSFYVDGSGMRKLVFEGAYRINSAASRYDQDSVCLATIEFWDKEAKSLGDVELIDVPLNPTGWEDFAVDIEVPARAKEATLTIGLLDGIGSMEMDRLEIYNKFDKSRR